MTEKYGIFNCLYGEIIAKKCINIIFFSSITQVMFLIESKAYHILTKTSSLAMCSPQAHTSPPNTFGDCSKNKRHSKYQFFIRLIMHQHIIIKVRNNMIRNKQFNRKISNKIQYLLRGLDGHF